MITIGIIGANSQVGTEICLHLAAMNGVKVVPIVRAAPAAAFLRRCGLECRVGSLGSLDQAGVLLEGCDAVVELSRPTGEAGEIAAATRMIVRYAIEAAPPQARYVFISSIMAFGMEQNSGARRAPLISRTVYGRTKRKVEKFARRLGRRTGREIYVLRLGEVHGELQGVSRHIESQLRNTHTLVPAGPSHAVFAHSIAEALLKITRGEEDPGRYTLVAEPEFTWKELHEHYCRRADIQPTIEEFQPAPSRSSILSWPLSLAYRRREVISAYVLYYFPRLAVRLRAIHARGRAGSQIEEMRHARLYRPYQPTFVGRLPGKRLTSMSDGRSDMHAASRNVRGYIDTVSDGCRNQGNSRP